MEKASVFHGYAGKVRIFGGEMDSGTAKTSEELRREVRILWETAGEGCD